MKILYISRAIIPSYISNSLSIMRMCQAFVDSGHQVVLTGIASSDAASDPLLHYGLRGGFQIVRTRVSRLWDNRVGQRLLLPGLILAWKTRRWPASVNPDLVYSRLTVAELALIPRDIPVVYEMHSLGPLRRSFIQRRAFQWLVRRKNVRRIVVTTNSLAEILRQELPRIDIVVARLSADSPLTVSGRALDSFKKDQLEGRGFRDHVGYTGNLDTDGLRGTGIICQAAAGMPDAAFHIVGGAQHIVEHWKRYAHEVNRHNNIFFYGHRNPCQIPLFLACFDVVLAPLQFRPTASAPLGAGMSPLKIPQYMAYKKAIVASDIPAHQEILEHNRTALLVAHNAVPEWVAAIDHLLKNPDKRSKMGEEAFAAYKNEFTPEGRIKRVVNGIRQEVSSPGAHGTTPDRLQVVCAWLSSMHERGIPYCHFKSNNRVADGLAGVTDLDVLIDRGNYTQASELLFKSGFKRFYSSRLISYPAVEDFLGFDQHTGKLIHLHLHWQVIVGEPHIKGFHLPWERVLLETRTWDEENRIFVAAPEVELLLLLTRAALKLRHRDRLRLMFGRRYFRGSMMREYKWLCRVADYDKVVLLAQELLDNGTAEVVKKVFINRKVGDHDIVAFRKAAMPRLCRYRTYSRLGALLVRWWRELCKTVLQVGKRFGQNTAVLRRGPAAGGIVVALLGADGSGKSTHAHCLRTWMAWKADVMYVYLGSGSGPRSFSRRLLDLVSLVAFQIKKVFSGFKQGAAKEPVLQKKTDHRVEPGITLDQQPVLYRGWKVLWALILAQEKLNKVRKAFRARNRGMVVIADRYPQNQIKGYNDGPLLDDLKHLPGPWNYACRLEAEIYNKILMLQPDLVVKLDLPLDVALERKKDTPPDMVLRKIEAVRRLNFAPQTRVVTIDGTFSLEQVSLAVKKAVWEYM
jgi:glycosyltransferase involved in cell wall biosynthesis/thymidylate kinase